MIAATQPVVRRVAALMVALLAPAALAIPDTEYRSIMRGVIAYYGSHTIDEAAGRVIHHVEAASNRAWIGDDFVRWFRFEDANLLISLNERFDNPLL